MATRKKKAGSKAATKKRAGTKRKTASKKKAITKRKTTKKSSFKKKGLKKKTATKKKVGAKKKVGGKKKASIKKAAVKKTRPKKKTAKAAPRKKTAAKKKASSKAKSAPTARGKKAVDEGDVPVVAPPEPQPPPEIGAPGPDFLLQTDAGEELSLADLSGRRVVLYFYPRDNTPGCTVEAGGFRDHHPDFEARNAVVLGVSRDSVKSHAGFKSKQNLPFTLLSDPTGQTIAAYGSWGQKKFMGRTFMGIQRTTVILDEDGIVRYIFPKVSPKEHAQEVLDALDELD